MVNTRMCHNLQRFWNSSCKIDIFEKIEMKDISLLTPIDKSLVSCPLHHTNADLLHGPLPNQRLLWPELEGLILMKGSFPLQLPTPSTGLLWGPLPNGEKAQPRRPWWSSPIRRPLPLQGPSINDVTISLQNFDPSHLSYRWSQSHSKKLPLKFLKIHF